MQRSTLNTVDQEATACLHLDSVDTFCADLSMKHQFFSPSCRPVRRSSRRFRASSTESSPRSTARRIRSSSDSLSCAPEGVAAGVSAPPGTRSGEAEAEENEEGAAGGGAALAASSALAYRVR